jgi:hypothetical protein
MNPFLTICLLIILFACQSTPQPAENDRVVNNDTEVKTPSNKSSVTQHASIDDTFSFSAKKVIPQPPASKVSKPVSSDSYYCFINGDKIPFEPPLDLFYIEFNFNKEMKTLTSDERDKLNMQFEKDLKDLGLVRLNPRRNVYRIVNSNYTRTQLVKKLLQKKEVHFLEAIYSTSGNERYFSPTVTIEFNEGMNIDQAKKILKNQQIRNYTLYFNEQHQLIADLSFESEEMLSYEFLIVANRFRNLNPFTKLSQRTFSMRCRIESSKGIVAFYSLQHIIPFFIIAVLCILNCLNDFSIMIDESIFAI